MSACFGHANYIRSLEHVQVLLSLSYSRRGDLEISLTSPMGTRSTLVAIRCGGRGPGHKLSFLSNPTRKRQVPCGVRRAGPHPLASQTLTVLAACQDSGCEAPPLSPRLPVCPRPFDVSGQGYNNWVFMSTHFWDEDPRGLWTLVLENKGYYFNTGESRAQAGARAPPAPCSGAGGLLTAPKPKAQGSHWCPLRD